MQSRDRHTKEHQNLDPSEPLKNRRHECFCQSIVNGGGVKHAPKVGFTVQGISAMDAYTSVGYRATAEAARRNASRLLTNADIQARIKWLQEEQAEKLVELGVASKQDACMVLTEIIRARQSDFLCMGQDGVCFHAIDNSTLNQAALKKVKTRCTTSGSGDKATTRQFDEIELESKIAAGKALADILGWNKTPQNAEDSVSNEKKWLDNLLAIGSPKERTPQTG